MRTLEILRALNNDELTIVDRAVKERKRASLLSLYNELKRYRKLAATPDLRNLFDKIFNDTYTDKKNYLIRNELRLLNDVLYDYLIKESFELHLKKEKSSYYYWLANSFFERGFDKIFEEEVDRYIEYANQAFKPENSGKLNDIKSIWMIQHEANLAENIYKKMAVVEKMNSDYIKHLRYRLREGESRMAFLQDQLNQAEGKKEALPDDGRTAPLQNIELNPNSDTDAFEQFLILKKHSFQVKGMPRVEVLRDKLKIELGPGLEKGFTLPTNTATTYNNIAAELLRMGHIEAALPYLWEGIELCEKLKLPADKRLYSMLLDNYMGGQIVLGNYKEAIAFYIEYEKRIKTSNFFFRIAIKKAYCHAFLHQADEALAVLPRQAKVAIHEQLLARMVYPIAFIIRQHYDLAENECHNIIRMIKRQKEAAGSFNNYIWIAGLFLKYLNSIAMDVSLRKPALRELENELLTVSEKVEKLTPSEYALLWLTEEMKKTDTI